MSSINFLSLVTDYIPGDISLCDMIKKEPQLSPGVLSDELVSDIKTEIFVQDLQNSNGSSTNIYSESESLNIKREDEKEMMQHDEENT